MIGKKRPSPVFLLDMAADILAVAAAYFTTYFLRFHTPLGHWFHAMAEQIDWHALPRGFTDLSGFYMDPENAFRIILLLSLTLCSLNAFLGLYSGRRFLKDQFTAFQLLKAGFLALLLFVSYLYLSHNQFHPRSTFLTLLVLHFLFAILLRKGMAGLMKRLRRAWGFDRHGVLLVGPPGQLDAVEAFLRNAEPHGLYPARRIATPAGLTKAGIPDRLMEEARACGADTLCCCAPELDISILMDVLDRADENGLTVKIGSPRLDLLLRPARIDSDTFAGAPLYHFSPDSDFAAVQRLRRIGSVLFSLVFIAAAAPLFLAVAGLIKLTSRGPVFFIQERAGWDGRPFRMFKFRTMTVNAERAREGMAAHLEADAGATFKIKNDPRVTPLGQFLRKFSLDEMPQFFNVLRGEMNLVGPRPLPAEDFRLYNEPWHHSRHKGLPGITGLWQVSGRSDLTFEQMCVLDVYYLHNASLSLDLRLLFHTVVTILFAEGAY
jgi:exopolysaccharide biosynthesis polyprenyl glycosylphosphotransferase